jgi:hypothetical protein
MMKKIAIVFATTLALSTITPAQASLAPSVVIIDSGFNAKSIPGAKEVCIIAAGIGCNNSKGFDESAGSAGSNIPIATRFIKEWNHGTIMADIVRQINPNANLILIRTAIVTKTGGVNVGGVSDFQAAVKWVIANKTTYNISAISLSRGQHTWTKTSGTCPINQSLRSDIISLQNLGVATVVAAGNDGDKARLDYPACISESVAISGIYSSSYTPKIFSSYRETRGTNSGVDTDFYAYGNFSTVLGPVAESTSASTAAFAGYWSKVSNGNYSETYKKIASQALQRFVNVLQ